MSNTVTRFLTLLAAAQLIFCSCSTKPEWKTFRSKDGGFSIDFPGTPADTAFLAGVSLQHEVWLRMDEDATNTYYKVNYIDLPRIPDLYHSGNMDPCSLAKGMHKADMLLYASQVEGTLREASTPVPGTNEAEEFKVDFNNGSGLVTVRKICANNKLYTLMVISRAGQENNALSATFFQSFKVLN